MCCVYATIIGAKCDKQELDPVNNKKEKIACGFAGYRHR